MDPASATGTNKKFFDVLQGALGVIPNMTRSMAQSPAVLEGYISLSGALSKRNVRQGAWRRTGSYAGGTNHCDYCASAHTVLGKFAGLSETQIDDALKGSAADSKAAAALNFANVVVEKRGRISDADFKAVTAAGFTPGEVGEIVGHVRPQRLHQLLQQRRRHRD